MLPGHAVSISDALRVDGTRTIRTSGAADNVNAAPVTITGQVRNDNAGGSDFLTIDAANGAVDGVGEAAVDLAGATTGLGGLTIDGAQIDLLDVTILFGNLDVEGTNINLNGALYFIANGGGAETITFTG